MDRRTLETFTRVAEFATGFGLKKRVCKAAPNLTSCVLRPRANKKTQ